MFRVFEESERPGVYNPVKQYKNKGHVTKKVEGIVNAGNKALVLSGSKVVNLKSNGD